MIMDMSDLNPILNTDSISTYSGYASTGAKLPYRVVRPFILDPTDIALSGDALDWDFQFSVYCCAASVEASFNLAKDTMSRLQGARIGSSTLSTSLGYAGAPVEGWYESQIIVQVTQGEL